MSVTNAQRNYKDTVFRMLFREKENLLSLYNALNQTSYTDVDSLEITTLENAVYTNYKNDISFVFDFELLLYEHQSTFNPNMPLRNLLYVTSMLQDRTKGENLYSRSIVRIPAPKFVVFYNGTDSQPEQRVLRLSDAFEKKQDHPALELTVIVYNVNLGHSQELLEACQLLKEYAQYVQQVRVFAKGMPFPEAVEKAVDFCIKNEILSDFLSKNRAEAIAMSIFEYDEERHMRSVHEEGRAEGENRVVQLMQRLIDAGRMEEMKRALSDREYREELYREYEQ
ncbi:MAG: hypothetical protein K2K07_10680 [Lachnospiraceae bacterium]|nr:hypothetical protein [Lachnospiraceae bacterium]